MKTTRRNLIAASGLLATGVPAVGTAVGATSAMPPRRRFTLGAQYYRPPFPDHSHWQDDLSRMRDAGLNTVQLWVMWPWVESKPGVFDFGDYDRLVSLAEKAGLEMVISTVAEVHPHWIFREIPNSEMVDHRGLKVVSSNRSESNFGLTPGGCFDHPKVRQRIAKFITQVVKRYRDVPGLVAWDLWNETRWNVQSDGLTCFCPHTVAAFRAWLDKEYGGLKGLNEAWKRRYGAWDEVAPGKLPKRTYTEMIAWTRFITARANQHAKMRITLLKSLDAKHPGTLHGPSSCAWHQGNVNNEAYPLDRGNDWAFAEVMDGVGCSMFPTWWKMDDADVAVMTTHVHSAANGKRAWLSEVQGGRAAQGTDEHFAVRADAQQRWLWTAIGTGIDTLLFWCWRDEIFGGESAGYGLAGRDGFSAERLSAMARSSKVLDDERELLLNYKPVKPVVGALFSPRSYYLHFAQNAVGYPARFALNEYVRALTKLSIPYVTVEEDHLDALDGLKVLFAPRALVSDPAFEKRIGDWVEQGGTLICEAETGAYSTEGFYREPQDRFLAKRFGIEELGRRFAVEQGIAAADMILELKLEGKTLKLPATQWFTPLSKSPGKTLANHADGPLAADIQAGKGRVIYLGTYVGDPERDRWTADFERLVAWAVRSAGSMPSLGFETPTAATKQPGAFLKWGSSGGDPMVFFIGPPGNTAVSLQFPKDFWQGRAVRELISKTVITPQTKGYQQLLRITPGPWGVCVLAPALGA